MSSRATLLALGGAVAIAFTGVLVRLANVAPASAAFWRCVYALPFLAVLALLDAGTGEGSTAGAISSPWPRASSSPPTSSSGITRSRPWEAASTVVATLQVVVVGVAAWLLLDERPSERVLVA